MRLMKIYLAKSGGDRLPNGQDFRIVLAEEEYQNSLFSFAFRGHEDKWTQYWNKLVNRVQITKNQ